MANTNNMNVLKRFLGLNDKKQAERTAEVAEYVHVKKNVFTTEMAKIQKQAQRVHNKTRQAHDESIKLKEIVDDVTAKIARAAGSLNIDKK